MKNDLKTCPVCHSVCFSDMDVCYGCLHRFSDADEASRNDASLSEEGFEPEEPAVLPLPGGLTTQAEEPKEAVVPGASTKDEEDPFFELGLTVRIPRELLLTLSAERVSNREGV